MQKLIWIVVSLLLLSCEQKKTELAWNESLYNVGSQASPRVSDLNEDGILDIVIGAGKEELGPVENGIMAIDGKTGQLIWQQSANAHMVGSATFYDINGDGTADVFIGGRNHLLKALDGKTGQLIWEYQFTYENDPILQYARFNFYNSVLVPDQTQDGIPELLTVNGGNWDAAAGSTDDRYPGVVMLFDLYNGSIIAADTVPDGQESYMSPIYFTDEESGDGMILFGSGGETMSGNLYLASLSDLMQGQLAQATTLVQEEGHGFIAPPSLVDINQDAILDILIISHAGRISAIDGKTKAVIWQQSFPAMESSNAFAIGQFNSEKGPDLLATLCHGTWPDYNFAMQVVLDGKTGQISYRDTLGCIGLSSPVIYDLDHDGFDEAILSINEYDCTFKMTEDIRSPDRMNNQLIALDFKRKNYRPIDNTEGFRNIYSTPWVGDLDDDGYLDIVYTQNFNPKDITRFLGMSIKRVSTAVRIKEAPKWGAYMGSQGNGIFED